MTQWSEQAEQLHARLFVVECVCGDEDLHRRHIEGRRRNIPGWHEVGWDHVQRMCEEFPAANPGAPAVDAVNPL